MYLLKLLFGYLVSHSQFQHVAGLSFLKANVVCESWALLLYLISAWGCFLPQMCVYEHLRIVFFAAYAGHLCSSWAAQGTRSSSTSLWQSQVPETTMSSSPLLFMYPILAWAFGTGSPLSQKQCSSCRWDGLGSAMYSPHLKPQLTGSCVLENWHITLQGAYCHP